MKPTAFLFVIIVPLLAEVSDAQNLVQLSYGGDTVVISRPLSTTTAPVEVTETTKKKGFFSGLKKFFGGSRSSTTEAPATHTTPSQKTDFNGNVLDNKNVDTIEVSPQSPTAHGQRGANNNLSNSNLPTNGAIDLKPGPQTIPGVPSQVQTNAQPKGQNERDSSQSTEPGNLADPTVLSNPSSSSKAQVPVPGPRDYVNPNLPVKPAAGSVNSSPSTPFIQSPSSPAENTTRIFSNVPKKSTSSLPSVTRDYVNPNIPAAKPSIVSNQNLNATFPSSTPSPSSAGSGPVPPQSSRDYVNPDSPIGLSPSSQGTSSATPQNRRDYVNPNIPLNQGQITSTTKPPLLETTLSPADFPPLAPPRQKSSRRPGRPNSPTRTSLTIANQGPVSKNLLDHTFTANDFRNRGFKGQQPATNQLATDQELSTISEALYAADNSNVNTFVTINYQGKTYSGGQNDEAPLPLLQIDERLYDNPTVSKMRALFDNYILDASVNEHVAPNERIEENEFLDAVMATPVMRSAMLFLQQKGIVTPDPVKQKEMLKTIWFTMYSRGKGKIGSSGFEHVFLAEIKEQNVMGLHNWLYFAEQEKKGNVNYKGWIKKLEISPNNKALIKYRFNFKELTKPVNGMFIGTSPELEMALYTICFHMREGSECPLTLNGHIFNIRTYSYRYRGKNLIGSAFPEIMAGQG